MTRFKGHHWRSFRALSSGLTLFLLAAPATVYTVPNWKTGTICMKINSTYEDLAGEYWTQNLPRKARGVEYKIEDEQGIQTGFLSETSGCVDVTVDPVGSNIDFWVYTRARVRGIDLQSWTGDSPRSKQYQALHYEIDTGPTDTFSVTKTKRTEDQRWRNLMVGARVLKDRNYHLDQGTGRACCLETSPGYIMDGTCSANPGGYDPITTPVQFQAHANNTCCGSTLWDTSAPDPDDWFDTGIPGVKTQMNNPYKFTIAHEFGHVIAGMRMGGKEQYPNDATEEGCNGQYINATDKVPEDNRGLITKEYLATAFREGWANFVAAATWNDTRTNECEFQASYVYGQDFDLDGDLDNQDPGGVPSTWQGSVDCEGNPGLPEHTAIDSWVDSRNWLADAIANSSSCSSHTLSWWEDNRSTVLDVQRMFWDLKTKEGVNVNVLADLYVDMCPRGWHTRDKSFASEMNHLDLPRNRLDLAADANGIGTEVDSQVSHIDH